MYTKLLPAAHVHLTYGLFNHRYVPAIEFLEPAIYSLLDDQFLHTMLIPWMLRIDNAHKIFYVQPEKYAGKRPCMNELSLFDPDFKFYPGGRLFLIADPYYVTLSEKYSDGGYLRFPMYAIDAKKMFDREASDHDTVFYRAAVDGIRSILLTYMIAHGQLNVE